LVFLRELAHDVGDGIWPTEDVGVTSVSINHRSGNILTLVNSHIRLFDINGYLLAKHAPSLPINKVTAPSCAISTDCPEYMENGVVAVSGHKNGDVMLWGINYDQHLLLHRHTIPDKVHTSPITALRLSGDRNDTLLVGDKSGKISVCKTVRLELLNPQELAVILKEVKQGGILLEDEFQLASRGSTPDT
jgi:WD40 repeat protein